MCELSLGRKIDLLLERQLAILEKLGVRLCPHCEGRVATSMYGSEAYSMEEHSCDSPECRALRNALLNGRVADIKRSAEKDCGRPVTRVEGEYSIGFVGVCPVCGCEWIMSEEPDVLRCMECGHRDGIAGWNRPHVQGGA